QFTTDGQGVMPFTDGDFASYAGAGNQNTMVGAPGDPQYELFLRGHPQSLERVGVEQQTAFLGADWQMNDSTTLWGHALFGRTHNQPEPSSSGAAGTGLGHAQLAYMTLYRDNPFLPQNVRDTMISENRQSIRVDQHGMLDTPIGIMERPEIDNSIGSLTLGFDHDLWGDWNLRGSWQNGHARKRNENIGWERLDRFYMAKDTVP